MFFEEYENKHIINEGIIIGITALAMCLANQPLTVLTDANAGPMLLCYLVVYCSIQFW